MIDLTDAKMLKATRDANPDEVIIVQAHRDAPRYMHIPGLSPPRVTRAHRMPPRYTNK